MSASQGTRESVYGLGITPGLGYITGPEGQRAEQEALRKDRSQARRVVVSLVGRERQGKTSLRRLLAGEPFNQDEPSTVGLERELVDTQALDPGSGTRGDWRSLRLDTANEEEYHDILGRRIHHRLENQRHRIPASRRAFNAFLTMAKIGTISYGSIFLFLLMSSVTWLRTFPVFGLTLVLMFLVCGATFGKKDGFGIAVGVYHLLILSESLMRYRVEVKFAELVSTYGTVCAYVMGAAGYGLMESVVGICFGMSLGLGIGCVYCLSRPEYTDYFHDGNPLLKLELHMLVLSCLFGLGFVQNKHSRLLIPPVLCLLIYFLPPAASFVFVCGTACGFVHGIFLGIGRSMFLMLNHFIKSVTKTLFGRHILRHCIGLIPGLFVSRFFFSWNLVTSPSQAVLAHVLSAVLLVAINEIDDFSIKILPCLRISISTPASSSSSSSSSYTAPSPSRVPVQTSASPFLSSNSVSSSTSSSPPSSGSSHTHRPKKTLQEKFLDQLFSRPRSDSDSQGSGHPASTSSSPTSVLASSSSSPSPKLVVRDFAGHPLYYSAHHVYMAGQCVYILVFSLVEARHDFRQVLRNLIDWLQSIFLHTGFPDTRVFLVGTHRDDPAVRGSGGEDFVGGVGQRLRKEIPRHFHNLLMWTDSDTPLFPVDNSVRDHRDQDHKYLRQQLLRAVSELNTDKFPVRYFYFFLVLDQLRSEGRLLADTDLVLSQCRDNQCAIRNRDDLDAMLMLFRRLGEVLYFPEDNLLQSVIVLSPHVVLGILSRLMDVPKMADRRPHFLNAWGRLASAGICSRALFEHVLGLHAKELLEQSDTVIYLLKTLNLICPLGVKHAERSASLNSENSSGGFHVSGLRYRVTQAGSGYGGGSGGGGRRDSGGGGGGDDDGGNSDDDNSDHDSDDTNINRTMFEHQERSDEAEEEQFLVPAALPAELPQDHCMWDTTPRDWELLMDGLPLLPHPAFLRLISVCATQDACDTLDDLGCPVLTACQSRAAFTFGRSRCYKLAWVKTSETADTYHGRLLKVVVAGREAGEGHSDTGPVSLGVTDYDDDARSNVEGEDSSRSSASRTVSPKAVLEFVWTSLSEIVRRDFRRCHVRLGVVCPCSAPHQVPCEEAGFHFLSLSDTRDGAVSAVIPDFKEFWCRGRHVVYRHGKVYESSPRSGPRLSSRPNLTLPILETSLCSMPHSLHASICDLLDVPHALGNDWTGLAGHLGKTTHQVELLRFREPRDPCDALLQDWASRDPDATIRDLVSIMHHMQRLDVVKTIEDFSV